MKIKWYVKTMAEAATERSIGLKHEAQSLKSLPLVKA